MAAWILSMVDDTALVFASISVYVWGMRATNEVCTVLSWTVRRGAPRLGVWFALARSCTGFGPTRFFKLGCLSLAYV